MNTPLPPKSRLNRQILEEAAQWFVEVDSEDLDPATRRAFDEWLRRSPEHVRAFLELLPVWEGAAAPHPRESADPESLIARFLSVKANVVPLRNARENSLFRVAVHPASSGPVSSSGSLPHGPGRAVSFRWPLAIATSIGVLAVCSVFAWFQLQKDVYVTGIGEQHSVVLTDGSSLELNALSKVRVRFTSVERNVELLAGQALFHVAKDPTRPFVVYSGETRVRALGTQFDVYRKRSGTVVTVIEGRVAVTPGPAPASPAASASMNARGPGSTDSVVELSPGEQVTITAAAPPHPTRANVSTATAWTQHRLTFQKTSLAEVVEEFNRYNTRQLRIESDSIKAFLVSGTFSSTDPTSLLNFLREQPGIGVLETASEIRIVAN